MKTMAKLTAWAFVGTVILYASLNPDGGVLFQGPMAALGLGLVGLGILLETKQRRARAAAALAPVNR
jgi:hypothetical protein